MAVVANATVVVILQRVRVNRLRTLNLRQVLCQLYFHKARKKCSQKQ